MMIMRLLRRFAPRNDDIIYPRDCDANARNDKYPRNEFKLSLRATQWRSNPITNKKTEKTLVFSVLKYLNFKLLTLLNEIATLCSQ